MRSAWVIGVITIVINQSVCFSEFVQFYDTDSSFEEDVNGRISVSRINIDGPIYDGQLGYNVIKIRAAGEIKRLSDDVLTTLYKGQLRFLGFDVEKKKLFAAVLEQYGSVMIISDLITIDPGNPLGKSMNIQGRFQFAGIDPNGRYCIMVDDDVLRVNLENRENRRLMITPPISVEAANPTRTHGNGMQIGGGFDLSGRFMSLMWDSPNTATLLIKNIEGTVMREIKIPEL